MTAVIRTGGKQYSVNKDDIIIVEKLPEEHKKRITKSSKVISSILASQNKLS